MRHLYLLLILLMLQFSSMAQFSDSVHYMVSGAATGAINRTNEGSTYVLNHSAKFGVRRNDVSLNSNTNWVYGEAQKKLTNNDVVSTIDFNLYKTLPHFYYWGLGNYTSSYSLKINNQYQYGVGIAYNIYDRPNAYLNLSDGILYENSDIQVNDTVRTVYNTFRNSLRLSFRFTVKGVITVSSNSFLQSSLNYGNDHIIRSNNSVAFKVRKWLSLTAGLSYNKITRTNKENLLFNYGLTIEKYF